MCLPRDCVTSISSGIMTSPPVDRQGRLFVRNVSPGTRSVHGKDRDYRLVIYAINT